MTIILKKIFKGNRVISFGYIALSNIYFSMASRGFFNYIITPNIKLNITMEMSLPKKKNSCIKLPMNDSRPLVIILEYLNAKDKQMRKFVDFYMNLGFNVLQVHLKPWQVLWPTRGSQIVAKDVAQFLEKNYLFSPLVVHGFSVGGYLWGEILIYFSQNLDKYRPVADRIKCKIFDSAVDVNEIPKGFPLAVFPKNPILRSTCEKYLKYHLKTFYEDATKHYNNSRKQFSSGIVKCPTLMITSNADPLSSIMVNEVVRQELAILNLECYIKVFEGSAHVMHFKKYKEEYSAEIESFFSKVNILQKEELKAKL